MTGMMRSGRPHTAGSQMIGRSLGPRLAAARRAPGSCRESAVCCLVAGIVFGVSMLPGCAAKSTGVNGVVTVDGKPIEKAIIQFLPERRDAPTAVTVSDKDGRYDVAVSSVPYRITITAERVVGQKKDDLPGGGMIDVYESIVPVAYTDAAKTPLTVTPAEGRSTTVDLDIKSAPAK